MRFHRQGLLWTYAIIAAPSGLCGQCGEIALFSQGWQGQQIDDVKRFMVPLIAALCFTRQTTSAPTSGVITAKTFIAKGHTTGAAGNGTTDDTDSIQQAVNFALANRCALEFEPGVYRITSGLQIEDTVDQYPTGFMMTGIAGPDRNSGLSGGVTVMLDGSAINASAILTIGSGAFRDLTIKNIAFTGRVPNNATPYGILFAGQNFSHALIDNVIIGTVNTAIGIQNANVGGNGELVDVENSQADHVNTFYSNNCGQAYCHHLTNCSANFVNGGVGFKIGNVNLGHNLDVSGFNSSFATGSARNVFLLNNGVTGNVNFSGGRQENVDTYVIYGGGSNNCISVIAISGMEFTNLRGNGPIVEGNTNVAQYLYSFTNCQFEATPGTSPSAFVSKLTGDNSSSVFTTCIFKGVVNNLSITPNMRFRDCRQNYTLNGILFDLSSLP